MQNNTQIVADIKNKLSPFWTLTEMTSLYEDSLLDGQKNYHPMINNTISKCLENQNKIIELLNQIK